MGFYRIYSIINLISIICAISIILNEAYLFKNTYGRLDLQNNEIKYVTICLVPKIIMNKMLLFTFPHTQKYCHMNDFNFSNFFSGSFSVKRF